MTYIEYLKSIGYDDAGIANLVTAFGGPDKVAKAFEKPVADLAAAQAALTAATAEKDEFQRFYNEDVLPKVSTVYQDAIQARTRAAALEERLKAATEFGFLADPAKTSGVVPGVGDIPPNPVPGSPGGAGGPASGAPGAGTIDPRYVSSDMFTREVNNIPAMLGKLTKISNEHHSLFGAPLLDIDTIIAEAQASKGKRNVLDIWEEKYKVKDKRAEITRLATEKHDKEIADAAVRKYASEHNMPFTRPGQPSVASQFTTKSTDEARQPWKGARDRKNERRQTLMDAMNKTGHSAAA